MKPRKSLKAIFLFFFSQNIQVIFFESVLTSLSTEILIFRGESSFSSWTLISCEVDGTGLNNSGIMVGSGIMENFATHNIATDKYLVHTQAHE